MQVTIATPKSNPFSQVAERLADVRRRLANRSPGRSVSGTEFGAYQRDRAYSASFTGSPMLPMRSHVGGNGGWSA